MPDLRPVPPPSRPWRVTAVRAGGPPLLASDCEQARPAVALAVVLAAYWPGLVVTCRRIHTPATPTPVTSRNAA